MQSQLSRFDWHSRSDATPRRASQRARAEDEDDVPEIATSSTPSHHWQTPNSLSSDGDDPRRSSRASLGDISPGLPALSKRPEDFLTDKLGLTVLHEPEDTPVADLVFVHGLGGGSVSSWSDEENNVFWPLTWLPLETSFSSARIYTYGYGSRDPGSRLDHILDVSDIARELLVSLRFAHVNQDRALKIGNLPLVFIAHSTGGLVAKKAYLLASSDQHPPYVQIAQATAAFLFFSTPHRGLHESSVINDILSTCVTGWHPSHHANLTGKHLLKWQEINEKFRDLATPLLIYSFHERTTNRIGAAKVHPIIRPHVATLDHPSEMQIPLDAGHVTRINFASRMSQDYLSIRAALQSLIAKFRPMRQSSISQGGGSCEEQTGRTGDINRMFRGFGPPEDDLSTFTDKRVEGSCEWVIEHPSMTTFIVGDEPRPRVLWCSGRPGSGKSVTATFIIEQLLEESKPCAYYYFRSGNQRGNALNPFLTSIACQLSRHIPEYEQALTSLTGRRFDIAKETPRQLWKNLFMTALVRCSPASPFFIVVDGLDETNQARVLLQKMILELGDHDVPLRLLVVSRPTLEIETSIERLSKRMQVRRLELDANAHDLELYVRDELEIMPGDDDFRENTVGQIMTKADGNFLWVHLVVQEILTCQTEDQVEEALQQVPKELEPLYERMGRRLTEQFKDRPQDQKLGHAIIMWTICAQRPLRLDELETALADDFPRIIDMRQTIQGLCGEFVFVDKRGYVSMMHASAREYLMTNTTLSYHVNTQQASHALFQRCIRALDHGRQDFNTLKGTIREFLRYAASSWPFHLIKSSDYEDQNSLALVISFLGSRIVLDWMFILAQASNLRAIVEASKALYGLLKIIDKADRDRSPLLHRLADKALLQYWTQDLVRVVGKFGPQIIRHPKSIYHLMLALCPRESLLYRQFSSGAVGAVARESGLVVRGRLNATWDECFAKFVVSGDSLPHSIMTLDRYFAILTKDDGTVHLYYSTTCEIAHRLKHGEHVLSMSVDTPPTRIVTYGFRTTMVWNIESGKLLNSIENPPDTRALAVGFQRNDRGDDKLVTFSDDRKVRSCALDAVKMKWDIQGNSLDDDQMHAHQVNAPHTAKLSPDGLYIAISYRGANPSVWYLGSFEPVFVAKLDPHTRRTVSHLHQYTRVLFAIAFSWNPLTGHLLGAYYGGTIFKWHPRDGDCALFDMRAKGIKCSADGTLFVTSANDGTLRLWDFEHFSPIYQLRYPLHIQDLDIGHSDARLYDLRQQYCNIWEPTSLLRALESDDVLSDLHSSKESDQSITAESIREQEDFEPITAFAVRETCAMYATGDDAGKISVSNFDGDALVEISNGPMSIEHLVWSNQKDYLASVDAAREIKIRGLEALAGDQSAAEITAKLICSVSDADEIHQVLFDTSGEKLMVVNPQALKIFSLPSGSCSDSVTVAQVGQWKIHPSDATIAIGFCTDQIIVMPWAQPASFLTLMYRDQKDNIDQAVLGSPTLTDSLTSLTGLIKSAKPERSVQKVLLSPNATLAVMEISETNRQSRHQSACLLIDMEKVAANTAAVSVSVVHISPKLRELLFISVGFIDADSLAIPSHVNSFAEHRRSVTRRHFELSTFVFVDREFWVCSVDIGFKQAEELVIRRHFFLPRDWQNWEWLELARVTPSGDFLCPRNGAVATISNGLLEEFLD